MALMSQLLATTRRDIEARVTDTLFKGSSFMKRLKSFGGVKRQGGRSIIEPLLVAGPGGGPYKGLEPFSAADENEVSGAEFDWMSYRRFPAISGMDFFKNSGDLGVVKLWNVKNEAAGMGVIDDVCNDIFAAPAGQDLTLNVTPLESIVDDGNTFTVGGLTSDDATLWQGNVNIPAAGSNQALTLADLETCELACTEGEEDPTDWVTSKSGYRAVWKLMVTNQRYVGDDKNAGFKNFTFNNALFHFDSRVLTTGGNFTGLRIYCLNMRHLFFYMGIGADMKLEDKTPTNADGLVAMLKLYCQLTTNARRYQGAVHDFAQP